MGKISLGAAPAPGTVRAAPPKIGAGMRKQAAVYRKATSGSRVLRVRLPGAVYGCLDAVAARKGVSPEKLLEGDAGDLVRRHKDLLPASVRRRAGVRELIG
jgi:hypothetical protein